MIKQTTTKYYGIFIAELTEKQKLYLFELNSLCTMLKAGTTADKLNDELKAVIRLNDYLTNPRKFYMEPSYIKHLLTKTQQMFGEMNLSGYYEKLGTTEYCLLGSLVADRLLLQALHDKLDHMLRIVKNLNNRDTDAND